MNILGIHTSYNALSHDPSASLIVDGKVITAIEEERLNRIKYPVRNSSVYLLGSNYTGLFGESFFLVLNHKVAVKGKYRQ